MKKKGKKAMKVFGIIIASIVLLIVLRGWLCHRVVYVAAPGR